MTNQLTFAGERYRSVANLVFNQPWAILPDTYAIICDLVRRRSVGIIPSEEEIQRVIGGVTTHPPRYREIREAAAIQTVICPKRRFRTEAEATQWIPYHGFKVPEGDSDARCAANMLPVDWMPARRSRRSSGTDRCMPATG